jgi:HEAT repeat protein
MITTVTNTIITTAASTEAALIAVLQSADSSFKDKCDACRELGRVGTKQAVAPLAALLGDEKLSHMARYALEPIPDKSVNEALRSALESVNGLQLVGVIGSIGVRRDRQSTKSLAQLLRHEDSCVAQAAARALGDIGTLRAANAIGRAMSGVSKENQLAFCEGLFRCAEQLVQDKNNSEAKDIYERLSKIDSIPQVKVGAMEGLKTI